MEIFWENDGWEKRDKHLEGLSNMPFLRPFPFIPEKRGLYIIRGPRQVGKTSWLKSILKEKYKKSKCFYLSCELINDFRELREILETLSSKDIILLDEVNYIKKWELAVKNFIDSGKSNIIVATGSHTYDLQRGGDQMPGRFENGGEFTLMPLNLEEFISARKQAKWNFESRIKEIEAYFRIGGFPNAIKESGKDSKIPKNTIKTLRRWIIGDIVRLGKSEEYANEILIYLANTIQSPLSFQSISSKTNLGSHHTVQEYIKLFESIFALRTVRFINLETSKFHFKKNRKFYFCDPLIYWLSKSLENKKEEQKDYHALAEMVAHEEIARKFDRFGYSSTKNGGEIDFISPKNWAIEVKWSELPSNLSKLYMETQIPFKTIWTKNNFAENFPKIAIT